MFLSLQASLGSLWYYLILFYSYYALFYINVMYILIILSDEPWEERLAREWDSLTINNSLR